MEVAIRPAGPDDASGLAPLVYSSGPAAFDYVFADSRRGPALGFLEYSLAQATGEFGYGVHTVAVVREEGVSTVVGGGACFDGNRARGFLLPAVRQIFGFYGIRRGLSVIRRGLAIERLFPPPKGTMHYIGHLGVSRDWRGRGLGTQLLERFFEVADEATGAVCALDVSVENPRAQALYERLGFEVTVERPSRLRRGEIRVPSHRRMEKRPGENRE